MAKCRSDARNMASRRRFLQMLGCTGIGSVLSGAGLFDAWLVPRSWAAKSVLASKEVFEEIPAAASGISWVHVNGRSPMAHLPETVGAGLRVPRLRQRRLDGHLSGQQRPCDFYKPPKPLRNALYHNNRDGTFTDVTQKAGVPVTPTAWASRSATMMATGFLISTSRSIPTAFSITTTETAPSPM